MFFLNGVYCFCMKEKSEIEKNNKNEYDELLHSKFSDLQQNNHCIFCDKKTDCYKIPIKPLNQDGKYSDIHNVCSNCYRKIFVPMRKKYKKLF